MSAAKGFWNMHISLTWARSSWNRTLNSALSVSSASLHFLVGNGTAGFSAERLRVGRWVKSWFYTCPTSSASLTSNAFKWEYMSQINFPLPWSCKLRPFKISVTSVKKARSHFHSVSISSGTVFPFVRRKALISGRSS